MRRSGWLMIAVVALALWGGLHHAIAPRDTSQDGAAGKHSSSPATSPATRSLPSSDGIDSASSSRRSSNANDDADAPHAIPLWLPPEATRTLRLIASNGPFPHRQDGAPFQNRERRLPRQARGYYREYTVDTPGSPDRGARRIIAGGDPPTEYFYSDDHYRSFRRFSAGAAQ